MKRIDYDKQAVWSCKIGPVDRSELPPGADWPLRRAIEKGCLDLLGDTPVTIFSGWGETFTRDEEASHFGDPIPSEIDFFTDCLDDLEVYGDNAFSGENKGRIKELILELRKTVIHEKLKCNS